MHPKTTFIIMQKLTCVITGFFLVIKGAIFVACSLSLFVIGLESKKRSFSKRRITKYLKNGKEKTLFNVTSTSKR